MLRKGLISPQALGAGCVALVVLCLLSQQRGGSELLELPNRNYRYAAYQQSLGNSLRMVPGQMLALPLQTFKKECGQDGSGKLCELGVNVGETESTKQQDAGLPVEALEQPYNFLGVR